MMPICKRRYVFLFIIAVSTVVHAGIWSKEAPYVGNAAKSINTSVTSKSKLIQKKLKKIKKTKALAIADEIARKNQNIIAINALMRISAMEKKKALFYAKKNNRIYSNSIDVYTTMVEKLVDMLEKDGIKMRMDLSGENKR